MELNYSATDDYEHDDSYNHGTHQASAELKITYIERVFSGIVILFIILVGCVGNSLIIVAVILSKMLRTTTNVFVVSLSVADILASLSLVVFLIPRFHKEGWPLDDELLCTGGAFMVFSCSGVSLYSLSAIACNRLLLIVRPNIYTKVYTPLKVAAMICVTWFIPISVCLFLPLGGIGGFGFDSTDYTCSDLDDHPRADLFNMVQAVSVFPVTLIVILVSYTWIGCHVRAHYKRQLRNELNNVIDTREGVHQVPTCTIRQEHIRREQLEITKNLFIVVCIFFVCYLPYFIASIIPGSTHVVYYLKLLTLANSSLNPIVYSYKHPHFKDVISKMKKCRCVDIPEPSEILQSFRQRVISVEPM